MTFNFGPVARTSASVDKNNNPIHNTINLASLPLHVMLNALVGSTSTEEFVAWLWHDLYKPAFFWVKGRHYNWLHTPGKTDKYGKGAFKNAAHTFGKITNVNPGLVVTHHPQKNWQTGQLIPEFDPQTGKQFPWFTLLEPDFISDQGDQVNLGKKVNYLQLSVLSEPALATALVRVIIAESFIEVVTKDVAQALRQAFINDNRMPIERVRFEFEAKSGIMRWTPLSRHDLGLV